jgi:hypothetical protein
MAGSHSIHFACLFRTFCFSLGNYLLKHVGQKQGADQGRVLSSLVFSFIKEMKLSITH